MRSQMSNLCLEQGRPDCSTLSVGKKRTYRQLERHWDLQDNQNADSLLGVNEDSSSDFDNSNSSKNRRNIKLEKKLICKAALETELIRCGRRRSEGCKERLTATGVFSTLIYDLRADGIKCLQEPD